MVGPTRSRSFLDRHPNLETALVVVSMPRRRRMRGDRDVPDASPIVGEEHQDEQEAVGRGWDHEEIVCDDLADVIPQEGAPRLRWRRLAPPHVLGDAGLPDLDAQFAQFTVEGTVAMSAEMRLDMG